VVWLNPAAWIGLIALAVPILIHILVQRQAERLAFPSLRFLQQTRLASVRRHVLEDIVLLAIRAAIVAAAVAALAGPLLITPLRHQAWNGRLVRATVVSDTNPPSPRAAGASASRAEARVNRDRAEAGQPNDATFLAQTFATRSLTEGIHRAVAWLDAAPPARRELVIVAPLALGSLTAADIAAVPLPIGIRFERSGTLPSERTIAGGAVLTRSAIRRQTVQLNAAITTVREQVIAAPDRFPIDIVCAADARPTADAAVAAVRSERVWAPTADRRGRLVLIGSAGDSTALADARPVTDAWAADAIAAIARDDELQSEASTARFGLIDARFSAAPWTIVASAADGRPLAVAASSPAGLLLVSSAEPSSLVMPLLVRAMAAGVAPPPDLRTSEVLPIPDSQLQVWTRPAAPLTAPRIDHVEQDDRRGLWALVLGLLALEAWVRRTTRARSSAPLEENVRVA